MKLLEAAVLRWAWLYLRRAAYRLAVIDLKSEGERQRAPVGCSKQQTALAPSQPIALIVGKGKRIPET